MEEKNPSEIIQRELNEIRSKNRDALLATVVVASTVLAVEIANLLPDTVKEAAAILSSVTW